MTVRAYVSRDPDGRRWPPDNSQETIAAIEIVKSLWLAFQHEPTIYCAIANLHTPNADLVVITEAGMGVLELKHYPGAITGQASRTWHAGIHPIRAGAGYTNPHHQVQAYAEQLRGVVEPHLTTWWGRGERAQWEVFKIQTAVCFTNPDAILDDRTRELERQEQQRCRLWEAFKIIIPADVGAWVAALRFEVNRGRVRDRARQFTPYGLRSDQVVALATNVLGGTAWSEIDNLMPTGAPYAYLTLLANDASAQSYSLDREEHTIGRDPQQCMPTIPERYERASRRHMRIERTIEGVYLTDTGSSYGTYLDGTRIHTRTPLRDGQVITVGGPALNEQTCAFRFATAPSTVAPTRHTDDSDE